MRCKAPSALPIGLAPSAEVMEAEVFFSVCLPYFFERSLRHYSFMSLIRLFWAHVMQEQDEGDSTTVHHHFVQQALQPLVDMLLKLLPKQEEGQDEDDGIWNLSLAGGNCLSLVSAVVGDEVLALIMPYIQVWLWRAFVLQLLGVHSSYMRHQSDSLSCSPCAPAALPLLSVGLQRSLLSLQRF